MGDTDLQLFLSSHPPFDELTDGRLAEIAAAGRIESFGSGELIMDAFARPSSVLYVIMAGQVDLWRDPDGVGQAADERIGEGEIFGFSAMLSRRSVGPRAVAVGPVRVVAVPAAVAEPAFASAPGARFLAARGADRRTSAGPPAYSLVDELIVTEPLVVRADDQVADVARAITERGVPCAVVITENPGPPGNPAGRSFAVVTDALLREHVLARGLPPTSPVSMIMDSRPVTAQLGDSAAEALITLLDAEAELILVLDRNRRLAGVIVPRDFAISPTTAGVSVHEQVRRAASLDELRRRSARVPAMLADLLSRGLASGRVIAVYSAIVDTIVRRALVLTFAELSTNEPGLSLDAFTWLSLGSNGRRESLPSSDVDAAVAFDDRVSEAEAVGYRRAFAAVSRALAGVGLASDGHGAGPGRAPFSRTNADWRVAARSWLSDPVNDQGAIMTSLLVDGRPIHGDLGLPAVTAVFADLRAHPATLRLLLQESLSKRARQRSVRDVFARRDTFDVKTHALLPIVNLARWSALSVGSAVLPTTERLQAAAGSAMLPQEQALNLIEAFEMLQRLRLRYQLVQAQRGERPSDLLSRDRLSPIDRSMLAQAVREIAAAQRRMDNVSHYLSPSQWSTRTPR